MIACPPFHVNEAGTYLEGCGTQFEGMLTGGYAMCPCCGLTFEPPAIPFGVHWDGVEGDPIECTDLPFYDFDISDIPEDVDQDVPLYEGDMMAAMAAALITGKVWVSYLAQVGTSDDDWFGCPNPFRRWEVSVWSTEAAAKKFIEADEHPGSGSFYFDARTHHPANDPTIEKPIGYGYVVKNGHHLETCGQCGNNLIEKADGDKRTGKYPSMCGECLLSEVS